MDTENILSIVHTIAGMAAKSGGTSRCVAGLCDHLCKAGVRSNIVTEYSCGETVIRPMSEKINMFFVEKPKSFQSFHRAMFRNKIRQAITQLNARIVHDNGIWLPINHASSEVCKKMNIRRVVSPHGMLENWALRHKRFKKKLAWLLYQKRDLKIASGFHATSVEEAKSIRKLGFCQPIAVIPNGVSVPEKILGKPKASKADNRIALFLSRIHPIKGILNLIDAWAKLTPDGWRLLIVGPEEVGHRAEIEGKIKAKGLQGSIEIRGEVNDIEKWELYKSSELFVLPSFSENFGIVVAEALAAGVPVITTKGTPWSDLQKYECGWWVDIGVEPLVQALKEAFQMEPARLSEMGVRGAKLVESKYSWPQIGRQMLAFYEWLLGIGPKPSCLFD